MLNICILNKGGWVKGNKIDDFNIFTSLETHILENR